jgi:branched-chain amino acid transport system permease protein
LTAPSKTTVVLLLSLPLLLAAGTVMADWLRFYLQVSLAGGLAALGVAVQMRAGLVSFGHGLYYCIGGYAAGMAAHFGGITDAAAFLAFGAAAAAAVSFLLGFLMTRYREIFFAMLSLAFSMILYGVLVKAEALGSTDGFNLPTVSYFGWTPAAEERAFASYAFSVALTVVCALFIHRYLSSPMGLAGEAIRENELRVEYLGVSVKRVLHKKYVIAAIIAAAGGVILAVSVRHVDPEMANWTTSGQFVFIALLSGSANVIAPLVGAFLLEVLRIYAVEISPHTWQMIIGAAMLGIILFLPKGLWSLVAAIGRGGGK